MPTRAIKLKLVVPRSKTESKLRQTIWTTHAEVNAAARYYESRLLMMRGQSYESREEKVSEEDVKSELLQMARNAQQQNLGRNQGCDDEVADLLRRLYEAIVPASVDKEGNAQQAGAFVSPLTDPKSLGFDHILNKLDRPKPNWISAAKEGDAEALGLASRWLESDAGKEWIQDTGSPLTWVKLAKRHDPGWPAAFADYLDGQAKRPKVIEALLVRDLRSAGLLPLFSPFFARRINGSQATVSKWDRLGFRLAVGHLLGWESWRRRTVKEHKARAERVESFKAKHLEGTLVAKIDALREYETQRAKELEDNPLWKGDREFKLTTRMTRGWNALLERWRGAKKSTRKNLMELVAKEQTKQRGRFGDPHLFGWLAEPRNHHVWMDTAADAVTVLVVNGGVKWDRRGGVKKDHLAAAGLSP